MSLTKYSMGFINGSLFYNESLRLAGLYLEVQDWQEVSKRAKASNLLQTRTTSTARIFCREVISRLKCLTNDQLTLLCKGSRLEQNVLLWLAVCKKYEFLRDFAIEVLREKVLRFDYSLKVKDYEVFFNAKAQWHEELEKLKDSSKAKAQQILFKLLRDAELLSKENEINPVILTPQLKQVLVEDSFETLSVLPFAEISLTGTQ